MQKIMENVKVCLINPPTRRLSLRPPLGLMYISSYLSLHGVSNYLIDQKGNRSIDVLMQELIHRAIDIKPDVVGITCLTTDVSCVLEIAKRLKDRLPSLRIVLGGIHPTLFPNEMLNNECIDFVVLGEGEKTFYELVTQDKNADYSLVDGIAFKMNGKIVVNKPRAMIKDLDEIPWPSYDTVDMNFYLQSNVHLVRGIPLCGFYVFSSRGCPYNCTFCVSKNIFGRTIRLRSPKKVVDELQYLHRNFKIDAFYLFDDTFAVNKGHAIEFCSELVKRRLPIVWGCETRVNLLDDELLKNFKKAGCLQVDFGIETGSERLLKLLKKGITVDEVRRACFLCKKHKIRYFSNFMINLPTETNDDVEVTLSLADELKSDVSIFNVTCPFPGTEIQNYLKEPLSIEDYPKMSSYVSYEKYINFIETRCKLSSHNISIKDILKHIQTRVPTPRDIKLIKLNWKYLSNLFRYFNFFLNARYLRCIAMSKQKKNYLRFILSALWMRNISTTEL